MSKAQAPSYTKPTGVATPLTPTVLTPLPPAAFYGTPGVRTTTAGMATATPLSVIPSRPYVPSPSASMLALPSATQPIHFQQSTFANAPPTAAPSTAATTTAPAQKAAGGGGGGRKAQTLRGTFSKELRALMYAFGDDVSPAPDSVNVMEEMVIEYIEQLCVAAVRGQPKPKLTADGLKRVLDRPADATKLARLNDLIFHQKNLAEAKRMF